MDVLLKRQTSYDSWLLMIVLILVGIGMVMVTSASLAFAESIGKPAWYFAVHHFIYVIVGCLGCAIATFIPLALWRVSSAYWLVTALFLLAVLLIPGVSREINGSVRWLFVGPISIQVSEFVKLILIIYMARYLIQQETALRTEIKIFIKPMALVSVISVLLLLEPDFGASFVMIVIMMGMLFLAGVPFKRFLVLFLLAILALGTLAIAAPYRLQRLTSFLHPWEDQFNSGYQLTQSLIAFGRGGWFGTGLGNSVQKLLYLPEPHTDFIYAVIAEELGLAGALSILLLFALLVWRIFKLGKKAMSFGNRFAGFIAYGVGLWIGLQAIISMGVNIGVFPTKGLTLPFMSYGGSSLIAGLVAVGILFRIEYELVTLLIKNKHHRISSTFID